MNGVANRAFRERIDALPRHDLIFSWDESNWSERYGLQRGVAWGEVGAGQPVVRTDFRPDSKSYSILALLSCKEEAFASTMHHCTVNTTLDNQVCCWHMHNLVNLISHKRSF